jgi:two-component system sensor histidine kinase/response regulator
MEKTYNNRVLLAEDNLFNQKVAVAMLKKLGLVADIANNGQEVLDKLVHEKYALILMDCEMPQLDGFEATTLIRGEEKNHGQHIPIIAMTAHSTAEDRQNCLNVGMDDYISKPFKIDDLKSILAKWQLGD